MFKNVPNKFIMTAWSNLNTDGEKMNTIFYRAYREMR